jgi:RNA polymerase sigma-70 factor (ECF subfamily)
VARRRGATTDAELIRRARRDAKAFRAIYERHVGAVLVYLRGRHLSEQDALDLTAETFAQALRSLPRCRPREADGSMLPWLLGIARHLHLTALRDEAVATRARRRLGIPLAWEEPQELAGETIDPEARAGLAAALEALPNEQRLAVLLRIVEECSYEEIATRLKCTPGAARTRVSRGLHRLDHLLQGGMR